MVATQTTPAASFSATACGKIIICGEHAVVYGKHALAVPIPLAVQASVTPAPGRWVQLPSWGIADAVPLDHAPEAVARCIHMVCQRLQLSAGFELRLHAHIPRGSGLGGSAALAVASTRALGLAFDLQLTPETINAIAFACEEIAHGTPSGVDNTVATYAQPVLFRKTPHLLETVPLAAPLPLVVGLTGKPGLTLDMVRAVAALKARSPQRVEAVLQEIDAVALAARDALQAHNLAELGLLMNLNHGLLCTLQVSSLELDTLVHIARQHGAYGAKLTGGGGGGAMIALCPDGNATRVTEAMRAAGFVAQAF